MKALESVGRTLKLAPLLLLGAAPPEPVSTWHVQRVNEGGAVKCHIESEKAPINDGYQNVTAQLVVTADNLVQIISLSTFDFGSADIGIQVDKNALVKADKLVGDKMVLFEASAATLIPQFKAGLHARVQLRFWPTWPVTGTHDAEVSLIGFTKAYAEMVGNCK
ncbi:MAG: hypothetical protein ACLQDQ_13875 [Myxococcaceae bacterium]